MSATVIPQATPNPNAMKFSLDRPVVSGPSQTYTSKENAAANPLAAKLFEIPGVKQVFFLGNFVTVTKDSDALWPDIGPRVEVVLREHFE